MAGRVGTFAGVMLVLGCALGSARADDLDHAQGARLRANSAIDVLKAGSVTPSNACVSALQDMQTTQQQLNDLNSQTDETASARAANQRDEVEIARDVLATDIDTTATTCGADARAACAAGSPSAALGKACAALQAAGSGAAGGGS